MTAAKQHGDLVDLIRRSIEDARARGRDYLGQTHWAVRWVLAVRPDMTATEAMRAVDAERLREAA